MEEQDKRKALENTIERELRRMTFNSIEARDMLQLVWMGLMNDSCSVDYRLEPDSCGEDTSDFGALSGAATVVRLCIKRLDRVIDSLGSAETALYRMISPWD